MLRYVFAFITGAQMLLSVGAGAVAHEIKTGDLDILHPWAAATVAHAEDSVVYMTIENRGTKPDR